jgi:hypothetical protein
MCVFVLTSVVICRNYHQVKGKIHLIFYTQLMETFMKTPTKAVKKPAPKPTPKKPVPAKKGK